MATKISTKPALLAAQMRQILHGLDQYADSFAPVSPTKQELGNALNELETKLQLQIDAAGKAESATQALYEARDSANFAARRMRDALYASFGKYDARLVAFGLDTLKNRRSGQSTSETENGSQETTGG